jgi:hypothetical protein
MDASTTRLFTLSRLIALALITLLITGLAYLRFAPDSRSLSVPQGAKAGDLILEPCEYPTENGNYAAECGTLTVPEKRVDPAVAPDRSAGNSNPRHLRSSSRADLSPPRRPGRHKHDL